MTSDPLTAALDKLAAHHDHLHRLDDREAAHFAALTERLTELTDAVTTIGRTLDDGTAALARLEALAHQVAELTALLTGPSADDTDAYQPSPPPAWWKFTATERQVPLAHLRAWVDQVYRPGYGHLAATLSPCWESHDLCLYGLDILSQLWSALYLQPERNAGLLSAQAEYQARLLPALAEQLRAETNRCSHPRTGAPVLGHPRSTP
jgi:hypothetical protein